jgi:glycosyltransferase involved in cell wall biosynthesis
MALIHNGVNVERYQADDKLRRNSRESFNLPTREVVFLLLGWDPLRKGVDVFINGAAEVLRQGSRPAFFLIIGREETRDFIRNCGVSSEVLSRCRVIDPVEDFSMVLNAVDVLVSASRSEGFGYAVVEAMAAGKIVICSDIPGVRETYGRADGVLLFPPEDSRKLGETMIRAMDLLSGGETFWSSGNIAFAKREYSLETWAGKIVAQYADLLPSSQSSR